MQDAICKGNKVKEVAKVPLKMMFKTVIKQKVKKGIKPVKRLFKVGI